MADTIGTLAYRLKLDSSQFVAGMVATRAEFAAARRIAGETTPAIDRYSQAMSNLDVLNKKKLITDAQHAAMQDRVQREHLESEAAVRRLTAAEYDRLKELRQTGAVVNTTAGDEAKRNAILERGRQVTEQSRTSQQRMNRELAEARMLLNEGAISASAYQRRISQIRGPGPLSGLAATAGGMARGMAVGAATIGSTAIMGSAIRTHAEIERLTAAMEAFTGSEIKAAKVMADIRSLSAVAGVNFDAIAKGAATMLAYNVPLDQLMGKLTQIAGIARGDTERFDKLALAFGQVSGAGRLMAQEVLQMINAGFNPLQEIARTTGKDILTLKKEMEEGKITVDMVSKAFDSATTAGGKFDGILDKISKTSAGSLGRLSAEWNIFLDTLGKSMPVKEGAGFLSNMLGDITTMFSEKPEAIRREIEKAKKNATPDINSQEHVATKEMNALALKSNELDAKLKKMYEDRRLADLRNPNAASDAKKKTEAEKLKREDQLRKGMADKLHELKMDSYKDLLPKEQNDKLQRTLDLLDDITKKKAELDYMKNKNIDALGEKYLSKEAKQQLDLLNKQYEGMVAQERFKKRNEAEADQNRKLKQDAADVKARSRMRGAGFNDQQMGFVDEVAKLRMLQSKNMIDQQTFEAERSRLAENVSGGNQAVSMPTIAAKGSQEAYRIITSAMTRKDDKIFKETQKQTTILKTLEQVEQRSKELLEELKEQLDFKVK